MKRRAFFSAVVLLAGCMLSTAADLPLQFRVVSEEAIASFPGGYGGAGPITGAKRGNIKKEPTPVSTRALYGSISGAYGSSSSANSQMLCRLDESKGTGKGYDLLVVDFNRNSDLTDDGVAKRVTGPGATKTTSTTEQIWFGPLQGEEGKFVAGHRPVFYVLVYLYPRSLNLSSGLSSSLASSGYLRLKSGWYLETEAEVDGQKHKIGIYDGNTDLELGQAWTPIISSGDKLRSFRPRDIILVDANRSGGFEADPFNTEAYPFSAILSLGKTPCKVVLNADCKRMQLEPHPGPIAEVSVKPHGEQVESVSLAFEQEGSGWELFRAPVVDSKVRVPAGNYSLYGCVLQGAVGTDDQVMISGIQRIPKTPIGFGPGKENILKCGAPLNLQVKAEKRKATPNDGARISKIDPQLDSGFAVSINGSITGSDGEVYTTFGKGTGFTSDPPEPTFTVSDPNGRRVFTGNLEFG